MRKSLQAGLFCLVAFIISLGRLSAQQKVFTKDIDNFWIAFDSVRTTNDSLQQIHFIQTMYIDKGTAGLKAFMIARNYSAPLYVKLINKYPKFWESIRPNTLAVKKQTDVSEFPTKWLAGVFKDQSNDNLVSLNVHEYIHTQQSGESNNVLAQVIQEGSCDFIAELVLGKPLQRNYIIYGLQHEEELKKTFKQEMFSTAYNNWLYNGGNAKTVADLGYFMGYEICKSYYNNSDNKKQAVRDIIELNYSDTTAVEDFLKKSKYYKEPINKEKIEEAFQARQPQLLETEPSLNSNSLVDTSLKQITFVFSKPMGKDYSINYGEKGKETWPITSVIGYSEDKKRFTVGVDLKPNHEYEFVITNRTFRSEEGYPLLKDYPVKFKTKP